MFACNGEKSSAKDSKNVLRTCSYMMATNIKYVNRNTLIVFIDIVANIYNFDFRFRGNDARLIKGALLLGLLKTLHHLIVFQMQIKPMQLLLQQYIEYTKKNNNSRLTLYKLELISDIYPTSILWNKVILVKWNQVEYAALDSLKCFSLLRPCRVSFSLNIRDMLHLILYGV